MRDFIILLLFSHKQLRLNARDCIQDSFNMDTKYRAHILGATCNAYKLRRLTIGKSGGKPRLMKHGFV